MGELLSQVVYGSSFVLFCPRTALRRRDGGSAAGVLRRPYRVVLHVRTRQVRFLSTRASGLGSRVQGLQGLGLRVCA